MSNRSYSLPLQRRVTDFGADHAFQKVLTKMKEHYDVDLPSSAPRKITLHHAGQFSEHDIEQLGETQGEAKNCIISETDGSMVPIVSTDSAQPDKRKKKALHYREARLTLAHEKGSTSPVFSATFKDVETAGRHIAHCINRVGFNDDTQLHCVGDGASWIANQIDEQFGSQATYLIDFYHVCEYLSAAATTCHPKDPEQWADNQKELLKTNHLTDVLNNLKSHLEQAKIVDSEAPVRTCHRYLTNRLNQLDYKAAIDNELPIGSGEIESAHRYIIQERLKIQGAWWLEENAEKMLALRTNRANDDWGDYWEKQAA